MITIVLDGRVVSQSKNLRGMRDYARKSRVAKIETRKRNAHANDPAGILTVTYRDGARCVAVFNSHAIMIDFVRERRSWRGAEVIHTDGDMGYLTRPGIIAGA